MSVTKMVDASTGGHLAQAPGRITGKTGEGESTSSELPSSTRHQRQHQLRRSLLQVLQASLRNSLRRAESAERALQSSRDQLHELRDRQAARPPVEPDLHACSVQQGIDPTAPQATQPVTRRPVFTQTGPDCKQPPPPPKAHFALDHRAAVWSRFHTGGALRAPTEETKAGRQEEKDEDGAAMARCRLQNISSATRKCRRTLIIRAPMRVCAHRGAALGARRRCDLACAGAGLAGRTQTRR